MNKRTKYLMLFCFPVMFFLASSSASAAQTLPPSEECLAAMDGAIEKFKSANSDINAETSEQAAWQEVVDAGCLSANPFDTKPLKKDSAQCLSYKEAATPYLAPINKAMRPVARQVNLLDKKTSKKLTALNRKREAAQKAGNKKLLAQIDKKTRRVLRAYDQRMNVIARQNEELVNTYDAPVFLVIGELGALGCSTADAWFTQNRASLLMTPLMMYWQVWS